MATHHQVVRLEKRVGKLERRKSDPAATIGAIEKIIKSWATWLIPLGVAWVTGSLETAAKIAGLLK